MTPRKPEPSEQPPLHDILDLAGDDADRTIRPRILPELVGLAADSLHSDLEQALSERNPRQKSGTGGIAAAAQALADELRIETAGPDDPLPEPEDHPLKEILDGLPNMDLKAEAEAIVKGLSNVHPRYAQEAALLLAELEQPEKNKRLNWVDGDAAGESGPDRKNASVPLTPPPPRQTGSDQPLIQDPVGARLAGLADAIVSIMGSLPSEAEGEAPLVPPSRQQPAPPQAETQAVAAPDQPRPASASASAGPQDGDDVTRILSGIATLLTQMAEQNAAPQALADAARQSLPSASPSPLDAAQTASPSPRQDSPQAKTDAGRDASLRRRIDDILLTFSSDPSLFEGRGDATLPHDLDHLEILLADPPPMDDFKALDALFACFPRGTEKNKSRALLAASVNLASRFGLPGRIPMTSSRAWRMLDPVTFESEIAQRLRDVGTFIADWQKTQSSFLILEYGEIEMIEWLFEALHPGYHADLLAAVMNFKVLSNRRMGLIRRILPRIRAQIAPLMPARKEEALVLIAHFKALLERIADPMGFAPIVDAASKVLEEVEKLMKQIAAVGAPPPGPPGGGQGLGRIG